MIDSSTDSGSLRIRFILELNSPSRSSHNIWTTCLFQPLFIEFVHICQFLICGTLIFSLNLNFSRLISAGGKVSLTDKLTPEKNYSSMTKIF